MQGAVYKGVDQQQKEQGVGMKMAKLVLPGCHPSVYFRHWGAMAGAPELPSVPSRLVSSRLVGPAAAWAAGVCRVPCVALAARLNLEGGSSCLLPTFWSFPMPVIGRYQQEATGPKPGGCDYRLLVPRRPWAYVLNRETTGITW